MFTNGDTVGSGKELPYVAGEDMGARAGNAKAEFFSNRERGEGEGGSVAVTPLW